MGWTSCRRRRGAPAIVLLEPGMGLEEVLREVAEAIGLRDRAFLVGQFADFLRVAYKFTRLLLDPGAGRLHGLLGIRFAKLPQEDRWLGVASDSYAHLVAQESAEQLLVDPGGIVQGDRENRFRQSRSCRTGPRRPARRKALRTACLQYGCAARRCTYLPLSSTQSRHERTVA